jgi:glycerophosphoryl diester phosphodiesterase
MQNTDGASMTPGQGLAIDFEGKHVFLKWHRLRRRLEDPLFSAANLAEGLRLGASMEIDLRVAAGKDFAVLHNETLDSETTGSGRVAEHEAVEIRTLQYRDNRAGAKRPVITAEDIAGRLAASDPDALLQLDMKDDLAAIGRVGVEHLAAHFGAVQANLIVSGDCTDLTLSLARRLPAMRRGLEPSFRLLALHRSGKREILASQLLRELRGPIRPHTVYLAWKLILAAKEDGIDLVRICHDEGAKVDAWTFTPADPSCGLGDVEWRDLLRLLELGVDQITTDDAIGMERGFQERMAAC